MKGKITLLLGGAVGYVLGTRAGRERYDQIKDQAQSLWGNPTVQEKASQAADLAREKGPEAAQKVGSAAAGAAAAAKDKVSGGDADNASDTSSGDTDSDTGGTGGSDGAAPYPTSASTL
ncbi:MAG: YtxH domain-containing protein [Nocardioidaceae bacterium]